MGVYDALGVPTIINAKGPATRLSGGPMAPAVAAAMAEAAQGCVDIAVLQGRASEIIAAHTGAEAGYVTSGAAAGLLLGTAACVAGLDIGRMARLPDTTGMKNQVIMVRSQRNFYDHAVRAVGVEIVEVGLPDRYAGAGVRDAEVWEIEGAVNDRTAAIFYVADPAARPDLAAVARLARDVGVPVLVDAAAQLPPTANLTRFIELGADLVAFSGGKAIGGPQGAGILAGRRDLIMSAALQNLDHDIVWDQWTPPANLIDKSLLKGVPQHGLGRACKVGKETIVGVLTALEIFVGADATERHASWLGRLRRIADGLNGVAGLTPTLRHESDTGRLPFLELLLDPDTPVNAQTLITRLQDGTPSINLDPMHAGRNIAVINPMCLRDDELDAVIAGVREILTA